MICKELSLRELIGAGYKDFWNCKKRYRVVKGSRGSKKSKTTALWIILNLKLMPLANVLVVRRFFNTLRDSCFSDLQWAVTRLGFDDEFKFTTSPLEITYLPTGQKILFRGFDDPVKLTSISVPKGVLCWIWIEEAYEINKQADFEKLDFSIRGEMPEGYFKQFTFTFNPWSATSWLKARFFDAPSDEVLALTTTYKVNEWLDAQDLKLYDDLKKNNPRSYKIVGLGEWGISEGLIFDRAEQCDFDFMELAKTLKPFYGLDFGFTDPTAFIGGLIDEQNKTIYIGLEFYKTGLTNSEIAERIKSLGLKNEKVYCDSAEPKSIEELRRAGVNAVSASKGRDSVRHGIQKLQNYAFKISPQCPNFYHEILNYTWLKDRQGNITDKPDHEFSHSIDAMRYGCNEIIENNAVDWSRIF